MDASQAVSPMQSKQRAGQAAWGLTMGRCRCRCTSMLSRECTAGGCRRMCCFRSGRPAHTCYWGQAPAHCLTLSVNGYTPHPPSSGSHTHRLRERCNKCRSACENQLSMEAPCWCSVCCSRAGAAARPAGFAKAGRASHTRSGLAVECRWGQTWLQCSPSRSLPSAGRSSRRCSRACPRRRSSTRLLWQPPVALCARASRTC